jgi:CheY-like chemotaxis protein
MARILVIDDHADVRVAMQGVLQLAGHSVAVAADGNSGLGLQRKAPADVVITDIFMPETDGMETIHQLRTEFPRLKIIAMSGGGRISKQLDYLAMARELGADMILNKPFDPAALLNAVDEVLNAPPRDA